MAPPLYFFARRQLGDVARDGRLLPSLLRDSKLDASLADVASAQQCAINEIATHGPGGASGVLLTAIPASGEVPPRVGYQPDFQAWQQAARARDGSEKDLWIGVDREHPPAPEDLLRVGARRDPSGRLAPAIGGGYWVDLADGHRWLVPVVRRHAAVAGRGHPLSGLPTDVGWSLEGAFVETLKPAYQPLFDDAAALVSLFYEDDGRSRVGEFEISVETGLEWALRILGLNYRIGRHEQTLLHPINGANVWLILGLAVDAPLMRELFPAAPAAVEPSAADLRPAASGLPTVPS